MSQFELEFLTRHGVYHMDGSGAVGDSADGAEVTYENLRTAMDEAAKYGVSLEMIHIEIPRGIILADETRDAGIATVCEWIEAAGRAGLRGLNYNFVLQLEGQRTTSARGRGGTSLSTFVLDPVQNAELTELGRVSKDEVFARMEYFLVRVMPVADRWKVQMALHPDDPPMPVVRGVERWHYPVFEGCTCAPPLSL